MIGRRLATSSRAVALIEMGACPRPRRLWTALSACFNPDTDELEKYFVGDEAQTLAELQAKYGKAPKGEPPATFN